MLRNFIIVICYGFKITNFIIDTLFRTRNPCSEFTALTIMLRLKFPHRNKFSFLMVFQKCSFTRSIFFLKQFLIISKNEKALDFFFSEKVTYILQKGSSLVKGRLKFVSCLRMLLFIGLLFILRMRRGSQNRSFFVDVINV